MPSALVHEVYRQVASFHAQPLKEKLKIKLDKHNVGYLPMMGDTLRTSVVANVTKPNMSEAFFMARDLACDHPDVVSGRRFRSANQWPDDLPGFREPLVEYCEALERLVQRLVRVYARALDLPAAYFDGPFTDFQYKLPATHSPSHATTEWPGSRIIAPSTNSISSSTTRPCCAGAGRLRDEPVTAPSDLDPSSTPRERTRRAEPRRQ